MKDKIIWMLAAILFCGGNNAMAQFSEGTFSIQPKVGIGTSVLTNQPDLDITDSYVSALNLKKGFYTSWTAGVELEYQLTDVVSIATGLNYSMQGARWKDKILVPGVEINKTKMELSYINLPIQGSYYVIENLSLRAGVQLGYLISAREKTELAITGLSTQKYDNDILDECKRLDVSIPVGINYIFDNNMVLGIQYSIGLTPVNKESLDTGNMRNDVISVTLGYKFEL